MLFTIGWVVIIAIGFIWEIIALRRPERGDTLSENVWAILKLHPLVWFTSLGIWLWMMFHFFVRTWVLP